jgi:hypothetical protein
VGLADRQHLVPFTLEPARSMIPVAVAVAVAVAVNVNVNGCGRAISPCC